MFSLFENVSRIQYGKIEAGQIDLGVRQLRSSLKNVQNYYRSRVFTTRSEHVLAKLLTMFALPPTVDPNEMLDIGISRSTHIERLFNFTSSLSRGAPHQGVFTHPRNEEILIAYDESFNAISAAKNWMDLEPVKFVWHSFSDITMVPPNGSVPRTEEDTVYISINIPMLLFMHRCWLNDRTSKESLHTNVQQFVASYVLPNMLGSYLDIAIANRFFNLVNNMPNSKCLVKLPFSVASYEKHFDDTFKALLKRCRGNISYEAVLRNIPAVSKDNAQEALALPPVMHTMQVWWALLSSRMYVMEALANLPRKAVSGNRQYNREIYLVLKNVSKDGTLAHAGQIEKIQFQYRADQLIRKIMEYK